MRRFLCFSLCLGLMVSACKKKSIEDSVNKAIAKAGAGGAGSGGGDGGGGDDGATTVTKKNKEAVLKACLPEINTKMIELWADSANNYFFLRQSIAWKTTDAVPLVVLYTNNGLPLQFTKAHGLGNSPAAVTTNLNAMAASEVIQKQFVARDGNASGWRVHISLANTVVGVSQVEGGDVPDAPKANSGVIIYDRENLRAGDAGFPTVWGFRTLADANHEDYRGGWFDCVVDDKTQDVTFKYAETLLIEA